MAAISTCSPTAKLHAGETYIRPSLARPRIFSLNSTFSGSKITPRLSSAKLTRASGAEPGASTGFSPVRAAHHSFDVVVIGAGIIGLTIARQFLTESDLSVAVVDRAIPCSGATGAGQGYIWMAHKTPGSGTWGLALRSHKLWEMMADSITNQGLDPRDEMGWMRTGSLLVGRTLEESVKLNSRVKQLSEAGLRAEFLTSSKLQLEEPSLSLEKESGAAFFPDDSQLDAHRAVAFIQKGNRDFAPEGRYAEFFHDPVVSLSRSGNRGEVKAVQTSKNTIHCRKAVVVATGCWTGSLMQNLYKESEVQIDIPVKPRKGHLLVVENFDSLPLNHGLMEAGYVNHLPNAVPSSDSASSVDDGQELSVSMTATLDLMGNLVLGSSRQFVGFNTEVDENIINLIWKRAEEFFPKLRETSLSEISKSRNVRVGLRPYMPDGKPVISHVPGSPNVYVAAGHEGGGLSLALGTAEMVADLVLGNPTKVDSAPFSIEGRCC